MRPRVRLQRDPEHVRRHLPVEGGGQHGQLDHEQRLPVGVLLYGKAEPPLAVSEHGDGGGLVRQERPAVEAA